MDKLTNEQRILVEENEKLIPWYCHKYHLDISDWYGTLAIVLCQSAIHYNSERGSFSTYFTLRAYSKMVKEFHRGNAQKNVHTNVEYFEETTESEEVEDTLEFDIDINNWIDKDETGILKLKRDGYTQNEIATKIGKSQFYVSQKLQLLRKELENELY